MTIVIFDGGFGTRLAQEAELRPQPMVEIGGKPVLWHILNICAARPFNEFIVALGSKAGTVGECIPSFHSVNHDLRMDLCPAQTAVHHGRQPNWQVHLVDAGSQTRSGGRLKRLSRLARRGGNLLDDLRRRRRGHGSPPCLLRK